MGFCVFLEKTTRQICANFIFSGFKRNHLFNAACIEKHCTRLLKGLLDWLFRLEIKLLRCIFMLTCRVMWHLTLQEKSQ